MRMTRYLLAVSLLVAPALTARAAEVGEARVSLDIEYEGKRVRIQRNQDTDHRLTNSFTKTSRPCPPFCIHPMQTTVGQSTSLARTARAGRRRPACNVLAVCIV